MLIQNPIYKLQSLLRCATVPLQVRLETSVALIAGWSDKMFDVLNALDNGGSALSEIG